jgi:hypothetical protein
MGTAVGTKVFLAHGWRAGGALMLGWTAWQLAIILLRGPHVRRTTWFGFEGGIEWRKKVVMARAAAAGEGARVPEKEAEKGAGDGTARRASIEKKDEDTRADPATNV